MKRSFEDVFNSDDNPSHGYQKYQDVLLVGYQKRKKTAAAL